MQRRRSWRMLGNSVPMVPLDLKSMNALLFPLELNSWRKLADALESLEGSTLAYDRFNSSRRIPATIYHMVAFICRRDIRERSRWGERNREKWLREGFLVHVPAMQCFTGTHRRRNDREAGLESREIAIHGPRERIAVLFPTRPEHPFQTLLLTIISFLL